ncbi:hypothetical protein K2173_012852 (mitochondrion) [Erythroxylum novogranatense]|uniref:Uncharacterized protein n=1 Tax=Erythroxylum novogranatense TaxID=1862640 RepID=A0AAV8S4K6_9ROSI|nr:hypothetical protein K2173_012852 [Erythroxylum novogranatense]
MKHIAHSLTPGKGIPRILPNPIKEWGILLLKALHSILTLTASRAAIKQKELVERIGSQRSSSTHSTEAWDFQDASFTTSCLPATGAREATLHPFQPFVSTRLFFTSTGPPGASTTKTPRPELGLGQRGLGGSNHSSREFSSSSFKPVQAFSSLTSSRFLQPSSEEASRTDQRISPPSNRVSINRIGGCK